MRAIERMSIKTKKFLVVIAVVGLDYQKDVLGININFRRLVQGVIEGDFNDRFTTQNYYQRFRDYEKKGWIEKSGSIYILTRKAWDILGYDVVTSIYENFPIRTEPLNKNFDIESYSELKKEKKKKNFRREFLVEIGVLGENNKPKTQIADYAKEFTRRIEKIFNLLNHNTNL